MKNIFECTGHKLKIPNIVDSKGVFLFDADGKRYMDLESGLKVKECRFVFDP